MRTESIVELLRIGKLLVVQHGVQITNRQDRPSPIACVQAPGIRCGESELTVLRWKAEAADTPDARHLCGEADAQIYTQTNEAD